MSDQSIVCQFDAFFGHNQISATSVLFFLSDLKIDVRGITESSMDEGGYGIEIGSMGRNFDKVVNFKAKTLKTACLKALRKIETLN